MRRAFVIGSNGPRDLAPLNHAAKDARSIAETLRTTHCGFEVTEFSPDENNADTIVRTVKSAIESCTDEDTFLLYFSGHGVLEENNLHLLLDHSDQQRLLTTTLNLTEIVLYLRYCKARARLLILDCCHAAAASKALGWKGDRNAAEVPLRSSIGDENLVVLAASGHLEKARELPLQGGFLTYAIIRALTHDRYSADKDGDGSISLEDMMHYIFSIMDGWNKAYPTEKVPRPQLLGIQRGPFYFVENPTWGWIPTEISWIDGITMIPLPLAPVELKGHRYVQCLSKHPLTNAQYQRYLTSTTSGFPIGKHTSVPRGRQLKRRWRGPFVPMITPLFSAPNTPVVCVSLYDVCGYCSWLNRRLAEDSLGVASVPSEQLWDYAGWRGGDRNPNANKWLGASASVHHDSDAPAAIDATGQRVNAWGYADMFGNVWEWSYRRGEFALIMVHDEPDFFPSLKGGGYLDDLANLDGRSPEIQDARSLEDGMMTRHSDLGFRPSGLLPIGRISRNLQELLSSRAFLEIPPVGVDILANFLPGAPRSVSASIWRDRYEVDCDAEFLNASLIVQRAGLPGPPPSVNEFSVALAQHRWLQAFQKYRRHEQEEEAYRFLREAWNQLGGLCRESRIDREGSESDSLGDNAAYLNGIPRGIWFFRRIFFLAQMNFLADSEIPFDFFNHKMGNSARPIWREHLAAILVRGLLGRPSSSLPEPSGVLYDDVQTNSPYARYIYFLDEVSFLDVALRRKSISAPNQSGRIFGAGEGISRSDMARVALSFLGIPTSFCLPTLLTKGDRDFDDVERTSAHAHVYVARQIGIMQGDGGAKNTFRPLDLVNRVEAATIVSRLHHIIFGS